MKKILLSAASLAIISGSALAADLPSRKEAVVAPVVAPLWQGFYAGLNAGYNFGTNANAVSSNWGAAPLQQANPAAVSLLSVGSALTGSTSNAQGGFIGGGQVGYNYQYGSNIVLGLEADIQGTNTTGKGNIYGIGASSGIAGSTTISNASGITTINSGVNWLGTVRGRVGYLWTPAILTYATGGLTYGGVQTQVNSYAVNAMTTAGVTNSGGFNQVFSGTNNQTQTLVGWNAGGGVEWMFMPNWSLKAEGIYWNMGNANISTSAIGVPGGRAGSEFGCGAGNYGCSTSIAGGNVRVNYQGVIARAGVNYHFNLGSMPVVAKF